MPKYIDQDKLVNRLNEHYVALVKKCVFDDEYARGYGDAISDMDDESAADVREVKHGHWIRQPISGYGDCICSVCGAVCHVHACAGIPTQRYCYRCGAKMLEEEK